MAGSLAFPKSSSATTVMIALMLIPPLTILATVILLPVAIIAGVCSLAYAGVTALKDCMIKKPKVKQKDLNMIDSKLNSKGSQVKLERSTSFNTQEKERK